MHWFLDPIKNHYADFSGRASRQEYWMFVLMTFGLSILVSIIAAVIGIKFLVPLWQLAILLPSFAIAVRRLHDINKSGWLFVIVIVLQLLILPVMFYLPMIFVSLLSIGVFVYFIVLFIFLIRKGDVGENKYGLPVGMVDVVVADSPLSDIATATEVDATNESNQGM